MDVIIIWSNMRPGRFQTKYVREKMKFDNSIVIFVKW